MKSLVLFLTLTITIPVWAQKRPATTGSYNSLLWEVSGKNLKAPSYLFGTYHFVGKSLVDSLQIIRQKFGACRAIAGEVILDNSAFKKMAPAMQLKNTTLNKLFTPAEYELIKNKVQELSNTDILYFNGYKPSALLVVLMAFTIPKTISATNPALDAYFQAEGKRQNKKVLGLETIEEQINLLLNGDMAAQKKHLLTYLRKLDTYKAEQNKLYTLYLKADLNGVSKMLYKDGNDYTTKELDALLKNRNLKWVGELPAIMQAQPTFIAVGAAHLVGQYGLIDQLRAQGYTVKAVKM